MTAVITKKELERSVVIDDVVLKILHDAITLLERQFNRFGLD